MKVVRDEKVKLIPLLLNRQKEISLLHLLSNAPLSYCFSWFTLLISASPPFRNTDALKQQETILLFSLWIFFPPSVSHRHVCVCVCVWCACLCVFVCLCVSHPPSFFLSPFLWLHAQSATLCVSGSRCQGVHVCQEGKAGQCRLLERAALTTNRLLWYGSRQVYKLDSLDWKITTFNCIYLLTAEAFQFGFVFTA